MKILKIYSKTCGPCKVLENNLQLAGIPHESVDVQSAQGEEIAAKYEVKTVPTLLKVEGNKVLDRFTGIMTVAQLKDWCS